VDRNVDYLNLDLEYNWAAWSFFHWSILMATITFYRQKRQDGGIRSGVEVDDDTVMGKFQEGRGEHDPALLWYVDVRCKGRGLPTNPEDARQWLIKRQIQNIVRKLLEELADRVPSGVDPSEWPLICKHVFGTANRRATISVACSAVRRVVGRDLAKILRDIADRWEEHVGELILVEQSCG
jgi:hypothetical protein